MAQADSDVIVPELLDQILSYLDRKDRYTCSLVNRQFYRQATRWLFRDLFFTVYQQDRRKAQSQLWRRLRRRPHLFNFIESLCVCLDNGNWTESTQNTNIGSRKFSDCMLYILHHAINLKRIILINEHKDEKHISQSHICHDEGDSALTSILVLLPDLPSRPDVVLGLYHHYDGVYELDGNELALNVAKCLTVPSLSVSDLSVASIRSTGYWKKLQWISQFSDLKELNIYGSSLSEDKLFTEYDDWQQLFDNIPLEILRIIRTDFSVISLPRTLRSLYVEVNNTFRSVDFSSWKAICDLKQLNSLYLKIDQWKENGWPERPIKFGSSHCLKRLEGLLRRHEPKRRDFIEGHIIGPILDGGSLRHIHFTLPHGTTDNPVSVIFPIGRQLAFLDFKTPYSSAAPYTFDSLVQALSCTPHLVNLHFPWPTIGPNGQRLDFSHCHAIATSCPYLGTIKFHLQLYVYDDGVFSKLDWTKPLGRSGTPAHGTGCDACFLDIPSRLQTFKMSHLITQDQRCLNLCTVLFDFLGSDFLGFDDSHRYLRRHKIKLDLFLSVDLNQVRRHIDIP